MAQRVFEYLIKEYHTRVFNLDYIKDDLNFLGKYGWEVCGFIYEGECYLYTFKKEIQ